MSRPRLLDLFCGAGGAAVGYHRAGFEVVGVDIEPQPHYPFEFHQRDALVVLKVLAKYGTYNNRFFHAIHASPPCQDWSVTSNITGGNGTAWLLTETLSLLRSTGFPWVAENTPGAPLDDIELCGTMFGLQVARHRLFEASLSLTAPDHPEHGAVLYSPAGHGETNAGRRKKYPELAGRGYTSRCREAMGIDWMNRDELSQAIPPAYTEFIGQQILAHLIIPPYQGASMGGGNS